jgi:hypothetical protein
MLVCPVEHLARGLPLLNAQRPTRDVAEVEFFAPHIVVSADELHMNSQNTLL